MREGIYACAKIPKMSGVVTTAVSHHSGVHANALSREISYCQLIVWEPSPRRFALPGENLGASCRGASNVPCPSLGGVLLLPVPQ